MDLSILIPVYNWNITLLLRKILDEINGFSLDSRVEIIVLDDCSSAEDILLDNEKFIVENQHSYLHYSRLDRNTGRSVVRNILTEQAQGEFFLFLDCDVLPDSECFIRDYLEHVHLNDHDVICGGRSYQTRILQGTEYDYYEYFGNKKEVKSAEVRNAMPWRHILTSNVMVRKSVYRAVPFNEQFIGYGYEDIEWGIRLAKQGEILHIENTASHLGLISKATAFEKMRQAVPNYLLLRRLYPAAFAVATVGNLAQTLTILPEKVLTALDRFFAQAFLNNAGSGIVAFILFQLNYSVLLAKELRKEMRHHDRTIP
ncbi:MAG: glycosyltransferase [Geobacteraceae bacterium]|nr:glycosyltransferase [Geobacteraceae bacterium]